MKKKNLIVLAVSFLALAGCASSKFKERQLQREKATSTTGMYCEFINGEVHSDVDVELNLSMARRCDSQKTFSITNYRNSAKQNGILYCCAASSAKKSPSTSAAASE